MSAIHKLKLIKIGNSTGVILPKEVLAELNIQEGDQVFASASSDGVRLSPYSEEVERQIEAGRGVMRRYRHTLRALAK